MLPLSLLTKAAAYGEIPSNLGLIGHMFASCTPRGYSKNHYQHCM